MLGSRVLMRSTAVPIEINYLALVYVSSTAFLIKSEDGINWYSHMELSNTNYTNLFYVNGYWILVGTDDYGDNPIQFSKDGSNWTDVTNCPLSQVNNVRLEGAAYCFDGYDNVTGQAAIAECLSLSATPVFSYGYLNVNFDTPLEGLANNGGSLYAAVTGWGGTAKIGYSSDGGANWIAQGNLYFSTGAYGIAYGEGYFVAVGEGTNTLVYSDNGNYWFGVSSIFSTAGLGVKHNGERFIAIGLGGNTIAYSLNGTSWSGVGTSVITARGHRIAWDGSYWYIIADGTIHGGSPKIVYSVDGATWYTASIPYSFQYAAGIATKIS